MEINDLTVVIRALRNAQALSASFDIFDSARKLHNVSESSKLTKQIDYAIAVAERYLEEPEDDE